VSAQRGPWAIGYQLLLLAGIAGFILLLIAILSPLLMIGPVIADRGWQAGILPGLFILSPVAQLYALTIAANWYRAGKTQRACTLLAALSLLIFGTLASAMLQ
jgi:hypothetical protein